ncbi:MAG: dTDP-glucose 4,6-dehydratase [Bdellovibrionota bacterium]
MIKKNILVTGGAGFIGSNFIPMYLQGNPDVIIVNFDKLTYAGDLKNLEALESHSRYIFVKGDICDQKLVFDLFEKYDFDGVFHFAAESHVDNSITGPGEFISTNIQGTFILLEALRKNWMEKPFKFRPGKDLNRFLHVSTDEVYGSLGVTGLFCEKTAYAPNSPYSASKASSDLLVRSYFHTYGLNLVTTNCSNNYGPKQHDEKLIPTIIRNALLLRQIPIYGDGKYVRDWLYVQDHCKGVELAFKKGRSGETYNIGGRNEWKNIDIARLICEVLDKKSPRKDGKSYAELISFVTDRPGHDRRYAIDATKIETELGWQASESFTTGIVKTIDWYCSKWNANIL